jgi:hypothetical protein
VQKIFAKGGSSGNPGRWFLELDDTDPEIDSLEFLKGGTSNTDRTSSNLAVSWETWQHIALTWDGSTTAANVHIYKDGAELTYQTTSNGSGLNSDAADSFYIGNYGDAGSPFNGLIDDVRIYDRVLTQGEISAQAASPPTTCAPAPTVTSVSPNSGPDTGGTSVTITGTGFDSGVTNVTFGGTAATGVTFVSSTQITVTTPVHAVGAVDVVVTNPDTQSGTLTNGYTYTGLIGHWTFDETGADADDPTWACVTGGYALNFDGVDDYVDAGSDPSLDLSNGTIAVWIKPAASSINDQFFVAKDQSGDNAGDLMFRVEESDNGTFSNKIRLTIQVPPSNPGIDSNAAVTFGQWTHAVITFGSGGMTMYVDGVLQTNTDATTQGMNNAAANLIMGSRRPNTNPFNGQIDELRLYLAASAPTACAAAPTVTSVAPTSGPDTGGTAVTITGTGFDSGVTNVTFGGTAATGVTFVSSTSITATTPAHAAGIPTQARASAPLRTSGAGTPGDGSTASRCPSAPATSHPIRRASPSWSVSRRIPIWRPTRKRTLTTSCSLPQMAPPSSATRLKSTIPRQASWLPGSRSRPSLRPPTRSSTCTTAMPRWGVSKIRPMFGMRISPACGTLASRVAQHRIQHRTALMGLYQGHLHVKPLVK